MRIKATANDEALSAEIPNPLPVGISKVFLYSGKKKEGNPSYPYFTAHVGFLGVQMAKNFSINKHGEKKAYRLAVRWRREVIRSIKDKGLAHGKTNKPGKRKSSSLI